LRSRTETDGRPNGRGGRADGDIMRIIAGVDGGMADTGVAIAVIP
jgi:hypothetical protein